MTTIHALNVHLEGLLLLFVILIEKLSEKITLVQFPPKTLPIK